MIEIKLFGLIFIFNKKYIFKSFFFFITRYGNTFKKNIIKTIISFELLLKWFFVKKAFSNNYDYDLCLEFEYNEHKNKKKYQLIIIDKNYFFRKYLVNNSLNKIKFNSELLFFNLFSNKALSFSYPTVNFESNIYELVIEYSLIPRQYKLLPRNFPIKDFSFLESFWKEKKNIY